MSSSRYKGIPWRRFIEFVSLKSDRFNIINELLKEAELEFSTPEISGNRHFIIRPNQDPASQENPDIPPVILVAHYDRYEGSPGANDNSAAVFILLETAIRLNKTGSKNWLIIFTDKEELKPGEGILSQGAYTLAKGFKSLKMTRAKIFCFDVCGTGDSIIISTTLDYLLTRESGSVKMQRALASLRNIALETAKELRTVNAFMAPTPFSDDAGFFRAGLAAQTITVLPVREYSRLSAELRKNEKFTEVLVNSELWKSHPNKSIPETWQVLNSPKDSHVRLTPENFRLIVRFAHALAGG